VMGVNDKIYDPAKHHILSNASCTTNCLRRSPSAQDRSASACWMTTVHAYTNDQNLLDLPHRICAGARGGALDHPHHHRGLALGEVILN